MLRRSVTILLAVLAAVAVPAAALATTPPEPNPPATETPSEPATTDPEAPATTEPAGEDGDDSGVDWLPIVLIVGGILALLVVLGALIGRSKRPPATQATRPRAPQAPSTPSPQASLLSTAQWIHDQLSLELMAANPTSALQRWSTERGRLDNVAIGAQAQFASGADPNWQGFGQTVSSLATALDTNLQLRAQDPADPELIGQSTDVVNRNRSALQQWINALRPTIDR